MHKLNKIRRFLAVLAVLTSLLVIATIAIRLRQGKAPDLGVAKLPVQVDVSLQKIHYTETKEGAKRWDLSAERADYNKETDTTSLSKVKLVVDGGDHVGELQVTADRAQYHNNTRDVLLEGNVRGVGSKGVEFTAPRITYLAARSLLQSADRVHFVDGGLELEGVGMEFQTKTRRLKLLKDVTAVYRPQVAR
ncbi:LPS export ABC transporter periplasmic protein LptC [Geomonas sp.]|uniref:LPS export ABC transporter periplasmic protein LptC n=1 Tax=Geomonas sp. TaxID=2651584 RepID=UPI002B491203|nr:LPS export ABC transporter periplasmic protein LptC [Geomonas sp.]HJV34449.1 LPS export ABC transporter periplasmic protein LptC [Geomonas sp.]